MKIPVQKIINKLDSYKSHENNEGRILWNMLLQAKGEIEVDIDDLIEMFYDSQSNTIVSLVEKYGSSTEILRFLINTKGLISDKTYQMLEEVKQSKIDKEVDRAIKEMREEKRLGL